MKSKAIRSMRSPSKPKVIMKLTNIERVVMMLRLDRLSPTKVRHWNINRTTYTWHVDNNDDRFVEATDSMRGNEVLLVWRDRDWAYAVVLRDLKDIVKWISDSVKGLASRKTL